jgi:hypothetical protein
LLWREETFEHTSLLHKSGIASLQNKDGENDKSSQVKRRWIINDKPKKELKKKKLKRIVQRQELAAIPCSNNHLQNYGTLGLHFSF